MKKIYVLFAVLFLLACQTTVAPRSEEAFSENMSWWKDARYGMFVHWGLSSLMGGEISWSRANYGAEKYDRLAMRFNPVNFDPDKWISVAEDAGMKYIVLTAKHHDGFCLWDSKANPHNIMTTPYGQDICRQLADAAHRRGMRLGWYFSCREWCDSTCGAEGVSDVYIKKMKGELHELLTSYGKVDLLWFDYDGYPCPADPAEIFEYCLSLQPDIIINNRLYPLHPNESHAYTGSVGMYATPEQFVGGYGEVPWETCSTSSTSRQWAIRFNDAPRPSEDMVWELIGAAGGNGNLLMNVGPDSLGVIGDDYVSALARMGDWIRKNDGVLYGTVCGPWKPTADYVSTCGPKGVNIITRHGMNLALPCTEKMNINSAYVLSDGSKVETIVRNDTVFFNIPSGNVGADNLVIRVEMENGEAGPVAPFSTSGSLAYCKPSSASSSLSSKYMHCPSSAFDDSKATKWIMGRRQDFDSSAFYGHIVHYESPEAIASTFDTEGWLEVDLCGEETVSSFKVVFDGVIGHMELCRKTGDLWETVAQADSVSGTWEGTITPVSGGQWRLNIKGCANQAGIYEFQLF